MQQISFAVIFRHFPTLVRFKGTFFARDLFLQTKISPVMVKILVRCSEVPPGDKKNIYSFIYEPLSLEYVLERWLL